LFAELFSSNFGLIFILISVSGVIDMRLLKESFGV
jgi:hypothetical protein